MHIEHRSLGGAVACYLPRETLVVSLYVLDASRKWLPCTCTATETRTLETRRQCTPVACNRELLN